MFLERVPARVLAWAPEQEGCAQVLLPVPARGWQPAPRQPNQAQQLLLPAVRDPSPTGRACAWAAAAATVLHHLPLIRRSGRKILTPQCTLLSRDSLLRRRAHGGFLLQMCAPATLLLQVKYNHTCKY